MADTNLIRTRTERCEGCGDRINVEPGSNDDYIKITRKREGERGVGSTIYYEYECAPLGNTCIPGLLEENE